MTDLLDRAVEAHGGLGRFNQYQTVSAYLVMGGALWELKGQAGVLSQVRVTVDLHQEHASFAPFKHPNQQTVFTPDRIAIETTEGAVVEGRTHPSLPDTFWAREEPKKKERSSQQAKEPI